ncbi:MAG: hypothetical protein A2Z11_04310 [Candidatus Woykebacteria bacterium RBG_16_43_9]|uniref:Peptidase A2 domain-containing protein n=1 Tax=Candidatus Woykebacteria bacterium RBG_16_43_9 TaxID=1802596 RepID=A0A1G1WGI2_9BACT|nr:MAG: hypothetical protein A2Z11_04310 [Candidatus Woykebacteria bacterium RBG_16_43_9]
MNFEYVQVTDWYKHQPRKRAPVPWLRVGFFRPNNAENIIYGMALADTGADINLITRSIGDNLGYNIRKGESDNITGFGGGNSKGYHHQMGYIIEDPHKKEEPITYVGNVVIMEKDFPVSVPQQTAILGTYGFFNHVKATFEFPKVFSIQPLVKLN